MRLTPMLLKVEGLGLWSEAIDGLSDSWGNDQ